MLVVRLPISCTSSTAWWCQVSLVSMATGKNTWVLNNWLYFVFLLAAAWVAADPASLAEFVTCESAYVSGTGTSQASGLPLDHRKMVVPPGLLPSSNPLVLWLRVFVMARQIISLRWLWRCCLGALLLQSRPWRPGAHVWGSHALLWLLQTDWSDAVVANVRYTRAFYTVREVWYVDKSFQLLSEGNE